MSDIPDFPAYDAPPEYDAGLDFNYDLWVPDTEVTLTNVPWNSSYSHTMPPRDWDLDDYIRKQSNATKLNISELSWVQPNSPVRLPLSVNRVQMYNYLRVTNPIQANSGELAAPDVPMSYYYFITSAEFGSPGMTVVTLQLDVWMTWRGRWTIGNAYIEQGHAGVANENRFDNYGRDFLTVPEGLDMGSEYQVVARKTRDVMQIAGGEGSTPEYPDRDLDGYNILLVTTQSLLSDAGNLNDPKRVTATGDRFQGMPSGAEFYIFKREADFLDFMLAVSTKPWVGECVISITKIPKPERYGYTMTQINMGNQTDPYMQQVTVFKVNEFRGLSKTWKMAPDWRNDPEFRNLIPARFKHVADKFFTYPYMIVELTTFTGTPVILKPESWNNPDALINEKAALVPPNQRIVFSPVSYNSRNGATIDYTFGNIEGKLDIQDDGGDYLDMSTQISNFPTMALVVNGAAAFMASNRNQLAYQHQQADWSQTRAGASAVTAANQADKSMSAVEQQGDISRGADRAQTNIGLDAAWNSAGLSAIGSVGGGLMSGSPTGVIGGATSAAMGIMQTGVTTNAAQLSQELRTGTSLASQDVALSQMQYNRDSNMRLARSVQDGDYATAIAGISARVQDAKLTQPSTAGQAGGEAFNMIHHASVISLRWKLPHPAEIRRIGDLWLRYGYRIGRFSNNIPQNLKVMSKFSYWRLAETFITGNMPEPMKDVIRGILENGTTVWTDPDFIGQVDIADNNPVEGYTL